MAVENRREETMVMDIPMPPPLPPRELTENELQNLMVYGQCWTCGEPRFPQETVTWEGGKTIRHLTMTCPNGHAQ